jgi:hypothetical protein
MLNITRQLFIGRDPEPERYGQAEYPLVVRCIGKKRMINQMIVFFRHSLYAARAAKTATFTRKW